MSEINENKIGLRPYENYTTGKLEECLEEIKCGGMSQLEAGKCFNIPKTTIKNKLKGPI